MTILWIVGKVTAQIDCFDGINTETAWDLRGVFDSEELAIIACENETYFIGPSEINKPWPVDKTKWTGCYYPLSEKGKSE